MRGRVRVLSGLVFPVEFQPGTGSNKVNISLTVDPDKMKADTKMVEGKNNRAYRPGHRRNQVTWPSQTRFRGFSSDTIRHNRNHHGQSTFAIQRRAEVTREELVALLNEDLAGEYQAIISYVIYSQVLKAPST